MVVRPVGSDDRTLLAAAFDHLGDRSRYQRFLIPKRRLTEDELRYFTDVDHHGHEAIGAVDPLTSQGVGIARFLRDPARPHVAEAAVAVVDEWQGRGLGGVLLSHLARRARREGIEAFTATLLTDNRAMRELFSRLGEMRVHPDGSTMEIEVALRDAPEALRAAAAACADGEPQPELVRATASRASASYGLRA